MRKMEFILTTTSARDVIEFLNCRISSLSHTLYICMPIQILDKHSIIITITGIFFGALSLW